MHCSHIEDKVFLNYTDSLKDDFIYKDRYSQELSDDRGSDVELEVGSDDSECQQVSAKSDDLDIDRDVTSDIDESGQCAVVYIANDFGSSIKNNMRIYKINSAVKSLSSGQKF